MKLKIKTNTIKWRIFKYNLLWIISLIAFVSIIFNIAIGLYIKNDIVDQLRKIASNAENTVLKHDPPHPKDNKTEPPTEASSLGKVNDESFRYSFMLDRSLKEPLTVLNADYVLFDKNNSILNTLPEGYYPPSENLLAKIKNNFNKLYNSNNETYFSFTLSDTEYIGIIKPIAEDNQFNLGSIVVYSSVEKVNQLQYEINFILLIILILSALITIIFSSIISKKISSSISSLSEYISEISDRNFNNKISLSVDDELQEFVTNINQMSEKLHQYDKAQKTFLQNISHEFRTPLMSIQGYAEGIKYDIIDTNSATDIIMDETKHLTKLVEDLLYLSRLDAIEESYNFDNLEFNELLSYCIQRVNGIAIKNNIKIILIDLDNPIEINCDEEKLCRAVTNILTNCIRYANSIITISLEIAENHKVRVIIKDDGAGFEQEQIPYIFDRFFMGFKGNFGLGLTISKTVIEKHKGIIKAENSDSGAVFIIELPII